MNNFLEFLLNLLSQFAGGTGQMENNLVRFSIPSVTYGVLLGVAWYRQRTYNLPREKLLVWGFGLGCASAVVMAIFVALQMMQIIERSAAYPIMVPVERALEVASMIVVAGAFLRYILDDARLAKRYILFGTVIILFCLVVALWQWPYYYAKLTEARFHSTWVAKFFEIISSVFIITAIFFLRRKRGWLTNVVTVALIFFLAGEVLLLINYWTDKAHAKVICPIGNSFPMLAIPLLGYVYIREQAIATRRAQKDLEVYRDHLEELVLKRTAEIEAVNEQLVEEVHERKKTEEAFSQLSRQYELILESAGEGICGIDNIGRFTFVNTAAARLLGYSVDELVGQLSYAVWIRNGIGGATNLTEKCPICSGYLRGIPSRGDDRVFWRKDGTSFPVSYVSTPAYEDGVLTGSVVVFRDITERKKAEAEIAQRNINLAAQNTIAATLSQSIELNTILESVLDAVLSVVKMEAGLVFLWDRDREELSLSSYRGRLFQEKLKKPVEEWNCCHMISVEAMRSLQGIVKAVVDCPAAHASKMIAREGIKLLVSVPLISNNQALGALTLLSRKTAPVQSQEMELLTSIGQQIGMAIENANLYQEAEREAEELSHLHQVSTVLSSTLNTARIYDLIVEQSVNLISCQVSCILACDENEERAVVVSSYGMTEDDVEFLNEHVEKLPLLKEMITHRQSVVIGDMQNDLRIPAAAKEKLHIRSLISVPLIGKEGAPGSLFLLDRHTVRHWHNREMMLVESFVNRAAVALMNASLAKQLEWAAALEERQRIAADMHDGLAQTVSLLKLQIEGAMDMVSAGAVQKALEELTAAHETIQQVSVEVRRSIASLQSTPQPRRSLQDQLKNLPEQIPWGSGGPVNFLFHADEPIFLPREQGDQALLVVQEALLNAHRHARAEQINLILQRQEGAICITVEDDGTGFEPGIWWETGQHHFGQRIMHSRAARIGAKLQIDSCPGKGTRVILTLPLGSLTAGDFHGSLKEQTKLDHAVI